MHDLMLDFHNTQDQFNVIEILNSFKKKEEGIIIYQSLLNVIKLRLSIRKIIGNITQ